MSDGSSRGPAPDRVIGPHEAARLLNVGPSTIQRWLDAGALVGFKTEGGHRRLLQSQLVRFARERGMPLAPGLAPAITPPSVLVVDDDRDCLMTMQVRIQGSRPDLEVHVASDGFEAGYSVHKLSPNLVFLDIRMPGISGVEVCRTIQSRSLPRRATVIGMTAFRDELSVRAMLEAGASEVLFKPLDMEIVASILRRYLPEASSTGRPVRRRSMEASDNALEGALP